LLCGSLAEEPYFGGALFQKSHFTKNIPVCVGLFGKSGMIFTEAYHKWICGGKRALFWWGSFLKELFCQKQDMIFREDNQKWICGGNDCTLQIGALMGTFCTKALFL